MLKETTKVLIIGSGPAGYTAAIYAARAGLSPVLYQGKQPGGQLTITTDVENYPGYPKGVQGPQMMMDFQEQASRFGACIRTGHVTKVDFENYPYEVFISEKCIIAESVIICTGASAKWLGLPSEEKLNGRGVSACAVCDGFFYRNQDVAIVGGGDSAAEEALYLSNICSKVYMIIRKNTMKASNIMQKRVKERSNIHILWNSETKEILGEEEVEGVKIYNTKSQKEEDISIKGFFVAIGHTPNTKVFRDKLDLDEFGYIITKKGCTKTNIKGVFAAGDVQDRIYRQAITAAGSGCMAALDAEKFLCTK